MPPLYANLRPDASNLADVRSDLCANIGEWLADTPCVPSGGRLRGFSNRWMGDAAALKVVVSPKPDETRGLSMQGLAVNDIGRLALAAWPVV
jgi:hypothetical protein